MRKKPKKIDDVAPLFINNNLSIFIPSYSVKYLNNQLLSLSLNYYSRSM